MTTTTEVQNFNATLQLGKIAYTGKRRVNAVELELNIRYHDGEGKRTVDLELAPERYAVVSICGSIKNALGSDSVSHGQNTDEIRKALHVASVQRICNLWDRWHLNDLKSGTPAQMDYLKSHPSGSASDHFIASKKTLEEAGLYTVSYSPKRGRLDGHINGDQLYTYGTDWLVEIVPDEVIEELKALFSTPVAPDDDSDNTAEDLKAKIKFSCDHGAKGEGFMNNPGADGRRCTFKYGRRTHSFDFWQGGGYGGKEPTLEATLERLLSDARAGEDSFENFCGDLGYDVDSRKDEKIFKACRKTSLALKRLFGDDYEKFQEMRD